MEPELSVLVEIDPDERHVRLVTGGHLTETNQRALYPLIRRARRLTSDTEVVIDLTSIEHLEGPALDLLYWEVEHDEPGHPARPVGFVLTRPRPASGISSAHGHKAYRTGSTAWTPPGSDPVLVAHRSFKRTRPTGRATSTHAQPRKEPTMTTPAARPDNRTTGRSPVQIAALAYGAVFLLVGVAGFIPGVTTGYDTMQFAGHESEAMLLGIFQVSILHNLVHLLYGVAGLALARTVSGARNYLRWGGAVYLLLWLYGLLIGEESGANFVPLNSADDWLHLFLGVTMVALSFLRGDTHDRTARNTTGPAH